MSIENFGYSDFDNHDGLFSGPDAAAFQAEREARVSLLKMLHEASLYQASGKSLEDGFEGEMGGHWQPYCADHDIAYPYGGHCPDCIVGVPHIEFQDAHTDYGRSVVRNAMQQRAWRQRIADLNASKERTGEPGELAPPKGAWLRQRKLERQRAATETPIASEPILPTVEPGRKRRTRRGGRRHHFRFFLPEMSVGLLIAGWFTALILLGLAMQISNLRIGEAFR